MMNINIILSKNIIVIKIILFHDAANPLTYHIIISILLNLIISLLAQFIFHILINDL